MDVRRALLIALALSLVPPALADDGIHYAMPKVDPCKKNHYILSCQEPDDPLKTAIGPVGAVTTDPRGNVYFSAPHVVFELTTDGALLRVAGNGTPGFSGDGGPAVLAQLDIPYDDYPEILRDSIDFDPLIAGLALDATGNLFIADAYNNRIRKVTPHGVISSFASTDPGQLVYGNLDWPQGLAFDRDGALIVSTAWGSLLRISGDAAPVQIAANNCGPSFRGPGLCVPTQVAVDADGNIFVPDGYCRVRKIGIDGSFVTVVGKETSDGHGWAFTCGYAPDGTPAVGAALAWPYAVAISNTGELHIADTYNNCIRKVDAAGLIRTVAGKCVDGANGWFDGDGGPAVEAHLNTPSGVAFDRDGNLFIADTENHRVRKVDVNGTITTVAGIGAAN